MASLTEHTLLNGLEENLKDAIEDVGGKIPLDSCIWKYPEIIRQQLIKNTIDDLVIQGSNGIKVVEDPNNTFTISFNGSAEHVYVNNIEAPDFTDIDCWKDGTSVQSVLEDLMYKVIPNIPTVTKGDIILTNEYGQDLFSPSTNDEYVRSLSPNTYYLRLFVYYQKNPIYISLDGFGECDFSNYYTKPQVDGLISNISTDIDILRTELLNSVEKINLNHNNLKTIVDDLVDRINNNTTCNDENFEKIFQSINDLKLEDSNINGSIEVLNEKFSQLESLFEDKNLIIESDIQNLKLKDDELTKFINDLKLANVDINNSIDKLNDKISNDIKSTTDYIESIKTELLTKIDALGHIDQDLINKIESEVKRISEVINKVEYDYNLADQNLNAKIDHTKEDILNIVDLKTKSINDSILDIKSDMEAMDKVHIHLINDAKQELQNKIQDLAVYADQTYATKDLVTSELPGLMSPIDKIKLDSIITIAETEITNIFNN